jgi:hypothetical protein
MTFHKDGDGKLSKEELPERMRGLLERADANKHGFVDIRAAREHGTYQILRKEVTVADKLFSEDLKGNVEIKSASIEYRRKGAER